MKTIFKTSKKIILGGALLCILALFTTSCENFLKGANIREDLEEAIEIANSNPVTIYVEAPENSGTVTPTQLRLKKKDTFEVLYKPAENWRFIKWEVLDRKTGEAVTGAVEFEDETAVETKAKLVKPQEGLVIYAKAVLVPKIVNVSPENNAIVPVYTPIVITFNTPVEALDAETSLFTYSNDSISITSSYGPIVEYFEEPYFNDEKTVLTIKPMAKLLQAYITEKNISLLDLNIAFSEQIVITKESSSTNLAEDSNASFSILYKTAEDTVAPGEQEFFASNKPISLENYKSFTDDKVVFPEDFERHASSGTFSTFDVTYFTPVEVYKNTVANILYIYGKYNDDGSGVNSVIVSEVRTHDNEAGTYDVGSDTPVLPVKYDSNNAVFISNGNVTEFIIPHKVKSKAGAVKITAAVTDSFDNITTKSFYVFKIDENSFINFTPSNFDCSRVPEHFENGDDNLKFNKADFQTNLKRIIIPCSTPRDGRLLAEKVFKIADYGNPYSYINDIYIDSSSFSFNCSFTYSGKEYQASDFTFVNNANNPDSSYWYCDLYTDSVSKTYVASVLGLKIKITVTDDFGNSMTREYNFPQENCVGINSSKLKFYDAGNTNYSLIIRERQNVWEYIINRISTEFSMDAEYNYYVIPVNKMEGTNDSFCFCGAMTTEPFNRESSPSQELNYTVELKQEPVFEFFPQDNNWGVEFILADDTWSKFNAVYYTVDKPSDMIESCLVEYGSKTVKYLIPGYEDVLHQPVKELYSENLKVSFYGVKNGSLTKTPLEKTIVTITDEAGKYDVIGPVVSDGAGHGFTRQDLYTYTLKVADYDSGLQAIYVVNEDGSKTLIKDNIENDVVYSLSARELEKSAGGAGSFTLEVTDKKNNTSRIYGKKTEFENEHYIPNRISSTASGKWTVSAIWVDHIYLLQTESDSANPGYLKWGTPQKIRDSYTNGNATGPYDITDGQFIRLDTFDMFNNSTFGSMGYAYFYTSGDVKSSGNYDYIQTLSEKTFLVASDAPTLVQTIKTKKSYFECQNWTIDEWEAYNEAFCVKQMDLTPESPYQFYLIPSSQLEDGDCYVVIAYFPNGQGNTAIGNSTPTYATKPAKYFMTDVMIAK